MLGTMLLMTAVMGQTMTDGPVLSEATKNAHARALAEFRANQHTIKPRVEAWYKLENLRLRERTQVVNIATGRTLYFASGARQESATLWLQPDRSTGFASVPPIDDTVGSSVSAATDQSTLPDLKTENFLLKCRLADSRALYRQSVWLYRGEHSVRRSLGYWGTR